MARVEIIILKYKVPEVEKECISRIIDNTDYPYKLVVYDTRNLQCHFSKIWNKLIRESTEDFICIMDSDAYVEEGWLTKLLKGFEVSNTALVVPVTDNCGNPQQCSARNQGLIETKMATPFVGLYRKDYFNKIGDFNESDEFAIFGQDTEWVHRAVKKGYKVLIQSDCFVKHLGNTSTRKASDDGEINFDEEREKAHNKFNELL